MSKPFGTFEERNAYWCGVMSGIKMISDQPKGAFYIEDVDKMRLHAVAIEDFESAAHFRDVIKKVKDRYKEEEDD